MNARTQNISNIIESLNEGVDNNSVKGKNYKELVDNLKKKGFELESADAHNIEMSKSFNDEYVTLYDKNNKVYTGLYNRYSDGGREIIYIKKGNRL